MIYIRVKEKSDPIINAILSYAINFVAMPGDRESDPGEKAKEKNLENVSIKKYIRTTQWGTFQRFGTFTSLRRNRQTKRTNK